MIVHSGKIASRSRILVQSVQKFHTSSSFASSHLSSKVKKISINDVYELYQSKEKISMITAHDFISGKIADESGADIVLVGDSLAMVALGYDDTNEIPFDEFLYHCKAVSRGVNRSFLVADLPFGTYESSISKAIETSTTLIAKGRVNAVKLEGGSEIKDTVKSLTQIGIPVVGHIGLTPQRYNSLGGFKVQGKTVDSAIDLLNDALAIEKAGAFAIVLEAIPSKVSEIITKQLNIPTIGIGAGSETDGQVLVQADMLGLCTGHVPKFVKRYLNGYELSKAAIEAYISEVKEVKFPTDQHTYKIKDEVVTELLEKIHS